MPKNAKHLAFESATGAIRPTCFPSLRVSTMAERVINNSGSSRAECREGLGFVSYWPLFLEALANIPIV